MHNCVFLGYSIKNSSVSDYFTELSIALSKNNKVVIITDTNNKLKVGSKDILVFNWPSKRPTKIVDFIFLLKLVKQFEPQLMLSTFGSNNMFVLVGYLYRVRNRIATYRTLSTQYESTIFKRLRKRWVYGLATKIITNSKATKNDLIATYKVPKTKIEIFPNAVKEIFFTSKKNQKLIVYAGRLHPTKGISILLEAFKEVVSEFPDYQLKILGGGAKDVGIYQRIASELKISANIDFLGSQPKEVVLSEFSKARFVVVPSLTEAFGFVVIESFSVKTPVIGSRTGGIMDSVRDGKDGFLTTPGDVDDLVQKMKLLCNDDDLVTKMSINCYERFKDMFELSSNVNSLCNNLEKLMK